MNKSLVFLFLFAALLFGTAVCAGSDDSLSYRQVKAEEDQAKALQEISRELSEISRMLARQKGY